MNRQPAVQCVNCAIGMKSSSRLICKESENLQHLLSDWICKEIEENDVVCNSCYYLLVAAIANDDETRQFGHKSVCLSCGTSLMSVRCIDLTDYAEHKLLLAQWTQPHQVKYLDRVCRPCFLRADRAIKLVKKETPCNLEIKTETSWMVEIVNEVPDSLSIKTEDPLGYEEVDIPVSPPPAPPTSPLPHFISLPNYRRAPDTRDRCIFENCEQTPLSKVPIVLKERLLIDYCFYIPPRAKICVLHMNSSHKEWRELFNTGYADLNAIHIENICSILKHCTRNYYSNLKFIDVISKNEVLCKYWLGMDYQQYQEAVKSIEPSKIRTKSPRRCLAIYLIANNTGFSYKKIGPFFGMSRGLVMNNIKIVEEYLLESNKCDQEVPPNKVLEENNMVMEDS